MRKSMAVIAAAVLATVAVPDVVSQSLDRFPRPEFESDYVMPETQFPAARSQTLEYVDAAVLALTLAAAALIVLRVRRRLLLVLVSVFAVAYFGFVRRGCVCPIGAIQNVAYAVFNEDYRIPAVVLVFFALPLGTALLYGRIFCSGVCPLGALQDLLLVKAVRVPKPVDAALRLLPIVYLAGAVLLAATGSDFIICRFDPFIGIFRVGANIGMAVVGAGMLLLGMFVARPYCRYFCPYGVLLGWASLLSHRHASITPSECVHCRLCENVCPVDAIDPPTSERSGPQTLSELRRRRRSLGLAIAAVPVLTIGFAALGYGTHAVLARTHRDVRLADRIRAEEEGTVEGLTEESEAFRASTSRPEELFADAAGVIDRYRSGAPLAAGFVGFAFGATLVRVRIRKRNPDYEPNRRTCVSCGRCFSACPVEHARRSGIDPAAVRGDG